ncbi:MAG: SDR family NAD(P)-dependent oxidoreductase, partial [Thermomicrobiales bacterium]
CLDLDGARAEATAAGITDAGGRAIGLGVDVSDAAAIERAVQQAHDAFGGLDIAVNCAGVDYVLSATDFSVEQFDRVLAVNLRAPFLISRAVFPLMAERGGGDIVNVASTAALRAWGNASAYHASKWGLQGLSRALGVEGRPLGIRVTTMIPGGMNTHWFDRFPDQGIPMPDPQHLQDPATVADAIAYAVGLPRGSAVQEILLTPVTETSWP